MSFSHSLLILFLNNSITSLFIPSRGIHSQILLYHNSLLEK